jgi:hypothetical protein
MLTGARDDHLYEELAARVDAWRTEDYPLQDYHALGEVFDYAREGEGGTLRFLRHPQLRALETYWYLRLVLGTPHVLDLYERFFPPHENLPALLEAFGVSDAAFKSVNYELERLWERIGNDTDFVRSFKLEALRETLGLGYPSYILALAMGAGKAILIGAIVATEFAMAIEYPDGPFVRNALVFAPGKTIIASLRELAAIPYEGWDCPSLFACALVRRLKTSNNFVLQAATRCLRQVPGNTRKARVYLSADNYGILDRQLQETYGESIEVLKRAGQESRRARLVLRKLDVPPLVVTKLVKSLSRRTPPDGALRLVRPPTRARPGLRRRDYSMAEQEATRSVLRQVGETLALDGDDRGGDARTAAVELAARYRLDLWLLYRQVLDAYGSDEVPLADLEVLAAQIEEQAGEYEVTEEAVDLALALVNLRVSRLNWHRMVHASTPPRSSTTRTRSTSCSGGKR